VPLVDLHPVLNEINQRKQSYTVMPLSLVHGTSALM
jgi:hypothetical protein